MRATELDLIGGEVNRSTVVGLVLIVSALFGSGCYTTKVVSPQSTPQGVYTARQWFTIAGAVALSQPAGRECEHGLASVESELSLLDWLLEIGLSVGGGFVGTQVCTPGPTYATCVSNFTWLPPFLFGARTVHYKCRQAPTVPESPPVKDEEGVDDYPTSILPSWARSVEQEARQLQ